MVEKSQLDRFKEAIRELEGDGDEARVKEPLKQLVKDKPESNPKKKP